ncbi:hypothetical protein RchiOBHm_Chr1g0336891 [Rosa chinensis]|uniref:Uncharacterized protein n=1 Tax=Rosa chinensis TaxID=74649 RepID=A0A2P6SCS7_ROSCH|nr:hypothetical protein RchiOBHm_Chr7g0233771 [Rosa chinensis]PRQ56482.1 hypothetical protein RchiOBHm_Chr1g0336891 [Rosa chinensis]
MNRGYCNCYKRVSVQLPSPFGKCIMQNSFGKPICIMPSSLGIPICVSLCIMQNSLGNQFV